jgi:hypothetical protein|tara:strand:+ start:408 stop:620 length:213 start_codon:yes stop_codon:yes gene_type:complete
MIELSFVLLLMIGDERVEYTPYQNLSECLNIRRKIKRNVGHTTDFDKKWSCKQLRVRIEAGEILEIVEDE